MKYIINLTLIFDPESRLLMLRNNTQLTVGLSNPATRLLSELIKNNKTELTREILLKHVWEDFGFSPSGATLSNHISELRKAFEALGMSKDILLTVPRIGFKLDAEIHPETKLAKESASAEHIELQPSSQPATVDNVAAAGVNISSKKPLRRLKIPALSLLFVLCVTAAAAAWMTLSKNEQPALIGIQDKCHIYTLNEGKHEPVQSDRARKMLTDEGIDCTQTDLDIYYMEARPTNEFHKIYFLSVCTKNSDMNYKNCNNFKQVE
ncbi:MULTISPECIES: winged helix-turn-helix domain-containing protein [unclassified Serratia (in: enterobacteria)]|uniref:winged helix-turn-helix domain-containing protein n=1 Tax=unclassified Serratia (in: enterobacteria) TaxID=2647522 RepID=UPI0018AB3A1F|nr:MULTISPECIES: winged helix-turn-helix domain-containing protein [unclassified Serratia (in: enterobacteria)]